MCSPPLAEAKKDWQLKMASSSSNTSSRVASPVDSEVVVLGKRSRKPSSKDFDSDKTDELFSASMKDSKLLSNAYYLL